jgi:hypothetical protein
MWLKELRTHSNPDAKVFLIGNKVDLEERFINLILGEGLGKRRLINLRMILAWICLWRLRLRLDLMRRMCLLKLRSLYIGII